MVDVSNVIGKAIVAVVIVSVFPIVMTSLNAMNKTGFDTTQIGAATVLGIVLAFGFVVYASKDF